MKVLIIIVSHDMKIHLASNVQSLVNLMNQLSTDIVIDYAGISSSNTFENYEMLLQFTYKIINCKKQLSKLCDFITKYKNDLDYDWYIKYRPEINLLEQIDFNLLSQNSINCRMRNYTGPLHIPNGCVINGEGFWKNEEKACYFNEIELEKRMDDQIYIFHKNVINMGAFDIITSQDNNCHINSGNHENESFHTALFNKRGIKINPIGINVFFTFNGIDKAYSTCLN